MSFFNTSVYIYVASKFVMIKLKWILFVVAGLLSWVPLFSVSYQEKKKRKKDIIR